GGWARRRDRVSRRVLRNLRDPGWPASPGGPPQACRTAGRPRRRGQPAGALLRLPPPGPAMHDRLRRVGQEAAAALPALSDQEAAGGPHPGGHLGGDQGTVSEPRGSVEAWVRAQRGIRLDAPVTSVMKERRVRSIAQSCPCSCAVPGREDGGAPPADPFTLPGRAPS